MTMSPQDIINAVDRYTYKQTNFDRYFGTPEKVSYTISCLSDYYEAVMDNEVYHSEFTDHFIADGDCPFGLVHRSTLNYWLNSKYEEKNA